MKIFQYGRQEVEYLKKRDKKLGLAIDRIGLIRRTVIPDLFTALIHSIVGQQISGRAAATVWARLLEYCGEITPQALVSARPESIQTCGMTRRKAAYIQNIAESVQNGELQLDALPALPDREIIRRLSSLPGVGVWTAEMLLIFSLERPDVVSWGDLAIRRGMMNLYQLRELDREKFERYRSRYSPCGSVASLYLWELSRQP